jgi:NADH pyrophosphatase NudC (nudix superfamily)
VHWDNPLPVVAAIVEHDGGVILARNKAWADPKMFGLITGFLEKGEAPEAAVAREVKEELSLDASAVHFVGLYPFERRNELIIAYHVPATGEVKLNEELADYRRIAPEKLQARGTSAPGSRCGTGSTAGAPPPSRAPVRSPLAGRANPRSRSRCAPGRR